MSDETTKYDKHKWCAPHKCPHKRLSDQFLIYDDPPNRHTLPFLFFKICAAYFNSYQMLAHKLFSKRRA